MFQLELYANLRYQTYKKKIYLHICAGLYTQTPPLTHHSLGSNLRKCPHKIKKGGKNIWDIGNSSSNYKKVIKEIPRMKTVEQA